VTAAAGAVVGAVAGDQAPRRLLPELCGFLLAGAASWATDLLLFAWLLGSTGLGSLTAKAISATAAALVAYLGNRLGTYRRYGTAAGGDVRAFLVFCAVQAVGAGVQLGCLAVSHYLLGFTSTRADLVSGNGIGMVLATALRFWGTRTLVFRRRP
jgi:putative flippase GtrA